MTGMTLEQLTDLILEIGLEPGDEIPYLSERNSATFVCFDRQASLLIDRPDRMIVRREGQSVGLLTGQGVNAPPALSPDRTRKSSAGTDETVLFSDLHRVAQKFVPETPLHLDSVLRASGNSRSLWMNILLQCGPFYYIPIGGANHYVWSPDNPVRSRTPKLWTRPARWSIGPVEAQRAMEIIHRSGIYSEDFVRNVILALRTRNIALIGAPGCGKNHFVRCLAEAFGVNIIRVVANQSWGPNTLTRITYAENGVIKTMDGGFIEAIKKCEESMRGPLRRPTWLFIDELSRSNPDKVFGHMMSFLGGEATEPNRTFVIPGDPEQKVYRIPDCFRIIAAYNDKDGNSVNKPSDAIMRRLAPCQMADPPNEDDGRSSIKEWAYLRDHAPVRAMLHDGHAEHAQRVLDSVASPVRTAIGIFRARAGLFGTAQLATWMETICSHCHCFSSGPIENANQASTTTVLSPMAESVRRQVRQGWMTVLDADEMAVAIEDTGLTALANALRVAAREASR